MAEPTNTSKTKGQVAASAEGEDSELSIDQLDSMILSEAPEFAKDLSEVASLPSDGSIDLDVVDTGQTFPIEENPWNHAIGLRKVIVMILPFLPKLWDFQYRFFISMHLHRTNFKATLIQAGPLLLKATKSGAVASGDFLKGRASAFQALTGPLKAIAVALMLVAALTAAFVYRSLTKGVLPGDKEYLMASLEEWSVQAYKYDPETEMDSFYDSPRTIQNIMSLPKMIVNLHPSPTSGPNPMAALEFFLEGLSPEAIVEVKDRETEIRDLFHQKYRGSRYSFGYPACPNLEDQTKLFKLLKPEENVGVRLTSGFLLEPEQSTSAIVVHHPAAKYFVV